MLQMLMDLVFRTTPGGTRLHYHELMQSIHQGMHALQVMPCRVHPLGLAAERGRGRAAPLLWCGYRLSVVVPGGSATS